MAEDSGRERDDRQTAQRADRQPGGILEGQLAPEYALASRGSLLGDSRLEGRGNGPVKVALMRQAQQTYGNRALRRALQPKLSTGATNIAAPPQPASSPPGGVIFIQRLQTGRAKTSKKNITQAKKELADIKKPKDVNPALEELAKSEPKVLNRYKADYLLYLNALGDAETFEWPLTYLRGRASRKRGKATEDNAIEAAYGKGVVKNNQVFKVEVEKGEYIDCIPDVFTDKVVADVKNVASQSNTEQLRAFGIIATGKDPVSGEKRKVIKDGKIVPHKKRRFELIVRSEDHEAGETKLTGPLEDAVDVIHYVIDK
jgi:hypothetical protein